VPKSRVVIVNPPFFRCVGSHNDRIGLELTYASRYLAEAEIDHVVVNADYLGSKIHVPWRVLFENEQMLRDAVDDRSPLLDQAIELVMQYEPATVIVAAGDSCVPTKDFGSPYIASRLSMRLRRYGVRTIGIGPMFLKDTVTFRPFFDDLFLGLVNRSLVDLVTGERPDLMKGSPMGSLPLFDHVKPWHATEYCLSNAGCAWSCSFCMAPMTTGGVVQFQPLPLLLEDIHSRSRLLGTKKLYFADMVFPLNIRRLKLMAEMLEGAGFSFACESRTDTVREETVELMKRIGVKTVKLGLESTDDETLAAMNKRQTLHREEEAIAMLRANGFEIVGYLILGEFYKSVDAMERTLDRAATLDVDHFVVNIAAYETFSWDDDRRYDCHFSMIGARRQGIPERVVYKALTLQENRKNPTVDLLATAAGLA